MQSLFQTESLSIFFLALLVFFISVIYFHIRDYKNSKKSSLKINSQVFISTLCYWFFVALVFRSYGTLNQAGEISSYISGAVIGVFLVMLLCNYYIHVGALALAYIFIIPILLGTLLVDGFLNGWGALFFLGASGSLLLLPAYGELYITSSFKKILFLSFILIFSLFSAFYAMPMVTLESFSLCAFFLVSLVVLLHIRHIFVWALSIIWVFLEAILFFRYKVVYEGLENIEDEEALLLLSNHISWLDWLVIQIPIKRRVRFMMNTAIFNKKFIKPILQLQGCIPISKHAFKDGIKKAKSYLDNNNIVCVFPEGSVSKKGALGGFYSGFEYINEPESKIIPIYISGLWGSIFSRSKERFCHERSGFRRVIRVTYGPALGFQSDSKEVKEAIRQLKTKQNLQG